MFYSRGCRLPYPRRISVGKISNGSKIGDILDFNNIKFEVISMSGPKIDRVKIILPRS